MRQAVRMISALFEKGAEPLAEAQFLDRFADETASRADLSRVLRTLSGFNLTKRISHKRLVPNFLSDTIVGKLSITRRGTGYVDPIGRPDTPSIGVSASRIGPALPGDILVAKVESRRPRRGRIFVSGAILAIVARARKEHIGRYHKRGRQSYVVPDEHIETAVIHVARVRVDHLENDDKVAIELLDPYDLDKRCEGVVTKVFGRDGAAGVDLLAVMHQFDLPGPFGAAVAAEMEPLARIVSPKADPARRDFRDHLVVTIDPKDARDFDDAVSLKRVGKSFEVAVHIADVAHYVPPETQTDQEARRRGTSIYLPTGVIPMLPERLSADLASLVEGRDRLTKSVVARFNAKLELQSWDLVESVIRSSKRLTYEHAQALLDTPPTEVASHEKRVAAMLRDVRAITRKLRADRFAAGSLELDLPEIRVELDAEGRVAGVSQRTHMESHSLIEELMLLSNRLVARYFEDKRLPLLRRIHENPEPEKLNDFAVFARSLGFKLGDPKNRMEIARLLEESRGTNYQHAVHYGVLRSLAHARYAGVREGHYALAFENYCHFTSPIRRYPDLYVHQILTLALRGKKVPRSFGARLEEVGERSSALEVRAEHAERALTEVLVLRYLEDKVGERYHGIINGVEDFGLFVELTEIGIDGLVPKRILPHDRWRFDPARRRLIGEISHTEYHLGQEIDVVVQAVNIERRFLDLLPVEDLATPQPAKRPRKRAGKKRPPAKRKRR